MPQSATEEIQQPSKKRAWRVFHYCTHLLGPEELLKIPSQRSSTKEYTPSCSRRAINWCEPMMRLYLLAVTLFPQLGYRAAAAGAVNEIMVDNLVTVNKLPDSQFVAKLTEASNTLARQNLLAPSDFIFDFLHVAKDPSQLNRSKPNPHTGFASGADGHTVTASSASFPALIGEDVSLTIGTIGPCGM